MKLYHLSFAWWAGPAGEYSDAQDYWLGTFSSEEKRSQAIEQYKSTADSRGYPDFTVHDGQWITWEWDLDELN